MKATNFEQADGEPASPAFNRPGAGEGSQDGGSPKPIRRRSQSSAAAPQWPASPKSARSSCSVSSQWSSPRVAAEAAFERHRIDAAKDLHKEDLADTLRYLGFFVPFPQEVEKLAYEQSPHCDMALEEFHSVVKRYAELEQKHLRDLFLHASLSNGEDAEATMRAAARLAAIKAVADAERAFYIKQGKDTQVPEVVAQTGERAEARIPMTKLRGLVTQATGVTASAAVIREALEALGDDSSELLTFSQFLRLLAIYRQNHCLAWPERSRLRQAFDELAVACDPPRLPLSSLTEALARGFGLQAEGHKARVVRLAREGCAGGRPLVPLDAKVGAEATAEPLALPEFLMIARRFREAEQHDYIATMQRTERAGAVPVDELQAVLLALGHDVLPGPIKEALEEEFAPDVAELAFDEVCLLARQLHATGGLTAKERQEFLDAFHLFDSSRQGKVSASELGEMLEHMGHHRSDEDVARLTAEAGLDGVGPLDFVDVVRFMQLMREDEVGSLRAVFRERCKGQGPAAIIAIDQLEVALQAATGALFLQETFLNISDTFSIFLQGGANFETFVGMADRVRAEYVKMQRKLAGFSEEEILRFRAIFNRFDRLQQGQVDVRELGSFLRELGVVPKTHEESVALAARLDEFRAAARQAGAEDVSPDGHPCVRFWELVQLLSEHIKHNQAAEEKLSEVAAMYRFSPSEINEFRAIFAEFIEEDRKQKARANRPKKMPATRPLLRSASSKVSIPDVKALLSDGVEEEPGLPMDGCISLVRATGVSMTPQQKGELVAYIRSCDSTKDGDLSFEGFLDLMRWLLDTDFAGVNHSAQRLVHPSASQSFN